MLFYLPRINLLNFFQFFFRAPNFVAPQGASGINASRISAGMTHVQILAFIVCFDCPGVIIDLGASYMHCVTAQSSGGKAGAADCRWRREPSRSVSGIAAVLQPLVADVAGKQNWESTLFAR